eukprot:TRINITY_DN33072_c0_g1_i1.p1 TRINITY_DN33072_c0_g1~~TRINITY_DN33072_c0_g1_i1.p1  ORF type:complete len:340 (-),score=28.75 TRINITY_DN33072_c0_g1_i1:152-1171(-)
MQRCGTATFSDGSATSHVSIASQYSGWSLLGKGGFGKIYKVLHEESSNTYAAKIEPRSSTDKSALRREADILFLLSGTRGFPRIHSFWHDESGSVMVFELLGSSLADLVEDHGKFSMKTTMYLAIQMLERIVCLHTCGFIHRDIKPANFMIGQSCNGQYSPLLYLIDFGLAKEAQTSCSRASPHRGQRHRIVGTVVFMSTNAHLGRPQSFRDDLEAMGYVLMHLVKGRLPWSDAVGRTRDEVNTAVLKMKQSMSVDALCKGLPSAFRAHMKYCLSLQADDIPSYSFLRRLWRRACTEHYASADASFDLFEDTLLPDAYDPVPRSSISLDRTGRSRKLKL